MAITTPADEVLSVSKEVNIESQPQQLHEFQIAGFKLGMLILGLVLSIFVAAMDNTIVSTALTTITSEFNALDQVTWVATSYLLTSTALQPLYGKFSDIFGRKLVMLFALIVFLVGSIACGAATNIIMLILFRAFAGIGGGGLISLSIIIISDIVPLERRGTYMGMIGANFAVASVVGPLLGGVLTDKISWRWTFYINLPVCVVAILVIFFFLNLPKNTQNLKTKLARIDYGGTVTLVTFIILAVLGLNWGGNEYAWNSPAVIVSLILALVFLVFFVFNEAKFAKEPIIPSHILTRNVISATLTAFLNGAVFFTGIIYTPIYYQVVYNQSAVTAGLQLLPLMLGVVCCSVFSGIFMSKTGIYRPLSRTGTFLGLLGTCLMGSFMRVGISRAEEIIFLLLIGLGIGLCIQTNTIASQAAVEPKDVAVATSLVTFSQSMGGVIGLAINGAVFQNVLSSYLQEHLPSNIDSKLLTTTSSSIPFSPEIHAILAAGYIQGIKYMFLTSISFFALSFISSWFLLHIPLKKPSTLKYDPNEPSVFAH